MVRIGESVQSLLFTLSRGGISTDTQLNSKVGRLFKARLEAPQVIGGDDFIPARKREKRTSE